MTTEKTSAFGINFSPQARLWVAVGSAVLAFCYWSSGLGARSTHGNAQVLFWAAMLFFGLMLFAASSIWMLAGDTRSIRAKFRPNLIFCSTILLGFFLAAVDPLSAALLTLVLAPITALAASIRESYGWWWRSKS